MRSNGFSYLLTSDDARMISVTIMAATHMEKGEWQEVRAISNNNKKRLFH